MPSVSLLKGEKFTFKSFAASVVRFFREFVDQVTVSDKDSSVSEEDEFPSDDQRPVKGSKAPSGTVGEGESKEHEVKRDSTASLFPSKHNVDAMLFGKSSVIPCSLDVGALETPMTISVTPEGNFSCKLNSEPTFSGVHEGSLNPSEKSPSLPGKNLPISPQSNSSTTPMKEEDAVLKEEGTAEADKEGNYVCHYCDAKFRIRGYLTRHIKKHAIRKAYHCPFFNPDAPPELRCHNSGGFSRRDTYKTHLKARHFIYPKGVKPQDRNKSSGHCSQCGQFFENTDQWVEQHIETGECKGLPKGYLKTIKSERKSGRLRMIKTSNGHSRFISTAQSVVEPKVLLNRDALEAMAIVAQNTNRSDILSKYGNNKIMMSSDNFKGEPKPKRKYTKRKDLSPKDQDSHFASKDADDSPQFSVMEETPFESGGVSSYRSNSGSDFMDDETALNEISSSLNPSPHDHEVLELVPSNSSASSQEYNQTLANKSLPPSNQTVNLSNFAAAVKFNDPFSAPLDMEQCCFYDGTFINDFHNSAENITNRTPGSQQNMDHIAINDTLRRQMDPLALAENHLRENEQYLNFYNFTYSQSNANPDVNV